MATIKLNERTLAKLEPPTTRSQDTYWDRDLTGFFVIVGKRSKAFAVEARVRGKKRRATIGRHGAIRPDGLAWNVTLARKRARELLGVMSSGIDPRASGRTSSGGITLRQALELHVADMKKRECSQRSIGTIEAEIPKYCAAWLDEPLIELRPLDLHELHDTLTNQGKRYLANRIVAEVSAVWNTVDRIHELPGRNPASRVRRNKLRPKRERIEDANLPAWHATIQTLAPVRRDLQLFVLFTGLRNTDARTIRWEHVDLDRRALYRPRPKGGESKAFELPLPATCVEILERRRKANAETFAAIGGDDGWVFPSMTRAKPYRVIPIAETKERRAPKPGAERVSILPGLHTLRRTYASVASDAGVPEVDRHCLMNHRFADARVHDGYIKQSWARLCEAQNAIEAALWARIRATENS